MKSIKTLILTAFISFLALQVSAQAVNRESAKVNVTYYKLFFGVNAIDNSNSKSQGPWAVRSVAFSTPFYLGGDYQTNENWSFGLNMTLNKFDIQGVKSGFFSMMADVNYYFIPNSKENFIDLYGILGGGFYSAFDNTSIIFNPGFGFNYWFSLNFGLNVTAKTIFSLDSKVPEIQNYFQYNLGIVYRIGETFN